MHQMEKPLNVPQQVQELASKLEYAGKEAEQLPQQEEGSTDRLVEGKPTG